MPNPISLRLTDSVLTRLTRRAARSEMPLRTLAQRYIDEGLRSDEHPSIRFVDGPAGRRPTLVGTGLDVWEAITAIRDNDGDVAEAAQYLEVAEALLHAAAAYYGAFPEEIDRWIEFNAQDAEEALRTRHAGARELQSGGGPTGAGDVPHDR